MEEVYVIVLLILAGINVFTVVASKREREGLLDRLMSKSLPEFKATQGEAVFEKAKSAKEKAAEAWNKMGE